MEHAEQEERNSGSSGTDTSTTDNNNAVDPEVLAVVAQLEERERQAAAALVASDAVGDGQNAEQSVAAAAPPPSSLYEELLRYHEEHPDEESNIVHNGGTSSGANNPPRQQERGTSGGSQANNSVDSDSDRKPAALPTGIYRQPLSRAYFSKKSTSLSPRTSQGGTDLLNADAVTVGTGQMTGDDVLLGGSSEYSTAASHHDKEENSGGERLSLYEELRRQCLEESQASRTKQAESDEELARRLQSEFNRSWPGSPGTSNHEKKILGEDSPGGSNLLKETKKLMDDLAKAPLVLGEAHGDSKGKNEDLPSEIEQQRRLLETFEREREQRELQQAIKLSRKENLQASKEKLLQDWSRLRKSQRIQRDQQSALSLEQRASSGSGTGPSSESHTQQERGRTRYRERDQYNADHNIDDQLRTSNTAGTNDVNHHLSQLRLQPGRQRMAAGSASSRNEIHYPRVIDRMTAIPPRRPNRPPLQDPRRPPRIDRSDLSVESLSRPAPVVEARPIPQHVEMHSTEAASSSEYSVDHQSRRERLEDSSHESHGSHISQSRSLEDSTTSSSDERRRPTTAATRTQYQPAETIPVVHATAITTDEMQDDGDEEEEPPVFFARTTMEDVNQYPQRPSRSRRHRRHQPVASPPRSGGSSRQQHSSNSSRNRSRPHGATVVARSSSVHSHESHNSHVSFDEDSQASEMVREGHRETEQAVQSGRARIVECQGCHGHLLTPTGYQLVFCPTCGVVSPCGS